MNSLTHLIKSFIFRLVKSFAVLSLILALSGLTSTNVAVAQKKEDKKGKEKEVEKDKKELNSGTFSSLKFRSIGPAFSSGRISDFAVNPDNTDQYYVAVASGHVWKTVNNGTTWDPVFDSYGAYSTADVEIDPNNPYAVWVGTGEYNSQRSVGYGDGVYKSEDGGKSFTNMGLKNSEHIGRIIIDPRNSHVYVAAQGPLWGPGGDRGLYKTLDGGKTWDKIHDVSPNTGITDIVMDPRNPDVLYCASYQRRRHVFTLINGGPESAIYKSTDAGKTWNKLTSGLPSGDVGRIGLAISPVNPDIIYAIIEAQGETGGFFRSTDRGASWARMNNYKTESAQYYNRIFCDPVNPNKVYSVETVTKFTLDGGKTWSSLGNDKRHVDDHAMWINPKNPDHFLIGGDGGIYETRDGAKRWRHFGNLPIIQFYRVFADNAEPFYYVYGGTQDNNSMGGPSRTTNSMGINNEDWFVTNGGDGFESAVDPTNPNIVYAQAQYGYIVRYDKLSGEAIYIQPQPPSGEAYRWNWNSPLIISPHSPTRLYFAANKLFRSDDRGNSWKVISPDLTQQIDRNQIPVMGIIQSPEAVAKNASTSLFGNIVSLTESTKKEGLIYVGTDDGLIQVTENGGETWTKYNKFPGVPDTSYISCLAASQFDENVVYATFDAKKNNNLKPFVLKSSDKGKSWQNITGNLPERGTVYHIIQDHIKSELLFAGTEFGIFFTYNEGKSWIQLKGGLPTVCVPDIDIQKRENDLVIATFGRSFYVLDDYSPLRLVTDELINTKSLLFPVKDGLMFLNSDGKYGQGHNYYMAANPSIGATFTYYLKEVPKTKKQIRQEAEKEARKKKEAIRYPTLEELIAEDNEITASLLFTITDNMGNIIRKIKTNPSSGINRLTWNFRYPSFNPADGEGDYSDGGSGIPVLPGTYKVSMSMIHNGVEKPLGEPQTFICKRLTNTVLPDPNPAATKDFYARVASLSNAVSGVNILSEDVGKKLKAFKEALHRTNANTLELQNKVIELEKQNKQIQIALNGDEAIAKRNENQPPSISERIGNVVWTHWGSSAAPTETMKTNYDIAANEFEPILNKIRKMVEVDIKDLERQLDQLNSPYTPGRIPNWRK